MDERLRLLVDARPLLLMMRWRRYARWLKPASFTVESEFMLELPSTFFVQRIMMSWKFYKNKQKSARWQLTGCLVRQQVGILNRGFNRMKSFSTVRRLVRRTTRRTDLLLSVVFHPLRSLSGYWKGWVRLAAKKSLYRCFGEEKYRQVKAGVFIPWKAEARRTQQHTSMMLKVVQRLVQRNFGNILAGPRET